MGAAHLCFAALLIATACEQTTTATAATTTTTTTTTATTTAAAEPPAGCRAPPGGERWPLPPRGLVECCFLPEGNPCRIAADLDGDGAADRLRQVRDAEGKVGLELQLTQGGRQVLGAGRGFGAGGTDFSWMTGWSASEERPAWAKGTGLRVDKPTDASKVLAWDGKRIRW